MTSASGARAILWQHMLDVARWSRYYAKLRKSVLMKSTVVRCLLACSGLGVVAGLIELFPEESRPLALSVSGIAVPILLIVDLMSGWARKAVVLGVISKDMSEVENKYRSLWEKYHLGQIDAADALSESDKLITQAYAISNRETFGVNDSINKDAVEEAYTAEKQRYATF